MLNRLILEFNKSPNNGKQIVELSDGHRLLLVHSELMDPATISLLRSRTSGANALMPSILWDNSLVPIRF